MVGIELTGVHHLLVIDMQPHLMNFKGRALYTDVDMINFRDIGAFI